MLPPKKLALVLSGGGARGAYVAGIIYYLRTKLLKETGPKAKFDILCGSSVGALNACFLAATSHNLDYQGKQIYELWNQLDQASIYRRGVGSLTRLMTRSLFGFLNNFFKSLKRHEGVVIHRTKSFKGFLDTSPFPFFLRRVVSWKQIALNIQNQVLESLSLTATNVYTGKMELFIDKHPAVHYTGRHQAHFTTIEARHALASAAIPILFPSVRIQKNYYCDGGLRLNTPLSPAIQLGADKILVIGLHHQTEMAEQKEGEQFEEHDVPPTMGQLMGQVLKTLFVDRLDYDLEQLDRINKITEWSEAVYGSQYLDSLNAFLATQGIRKDIAARGLKKIEAVSLFPSVDIRKIFGECMDDPRFLKRGFTLLEKMLLKVLDVDLRQGKDFLSFILFEPSYIKKLIELGYADAERNKEQLLSFFASR